MSNWSKELPTKPGLYAWCDGRGGATHVACVSLYPRDGLHVTCNNEGRWMQFWNRDFPNGLWQPLHIDLPAPYVPPKPPVVEVYSATRREKPVTVFLYKLGESFVGVEPGSPGFDCIAAWSICGNYYTDIQRVPDEP